MKKRIYIILFYLLIIIIPNEYVSAGSIASAIGGAGGTVSGNSCVSNLYCFYNNSSHRSVKVSLVKANGNDAGKLYQNTRSIIITNNVGMFADGSYVYGKWNGNGINYNINNHMTIEKDKNGKNIFSSNSDGAFGTWSDKWDSWNEISNLFDSKDENLYKKILEKIKESGFYDTYKNYSADADDYVITIEPVVSLQLNSKYYFFTIKGCNHINTNSKGKSFNTRLEEYKTWLYIKSGAGYNAINNIVSNLKFTTIVGLQAFKANGVGIVSIVDANRCDEETECCFDSSGNYHSNYSGSTSNYKDDGTSCSPLTPPPNTPTSSTTCMITSRFIDSGALDISKNDGDVEYDDCASGGEGKIIGKLTYKREYKKAKTETKSANSIATYKCESSYSIITNGTTNTHTKVVKKDDKCQVYCGGKDPCKYKNRGTKAKPDYRCGPGWKNIKENGKNKCVQSFGTIFDKYIYSCDSGYTSSGSGSSMTCTKVYSPVTREVEVGVEISDNSNAQFTQDIENIWSGKAIGFNILTTNTITAKIEGKNEKEFLMDPVEELKEDGCTVANEVYELGSFYTRLKNNVKSKINGTLDESYDVKADNNSIKNDFSSEKTTTEVESGNYHNPDGGLTRGDAYWDTTTITKTITRTIAPMKSILNIKSGKVEYGDDLSEDESFVQDGVWYTSIKSKDDFLTMKAEMKRFVLDSSKKITYNCSTHYTKKIYKCIRRCDPGEPGEFEPTYYYRQIALDNPFPKGNYSNTNWKNYYNNEDNLDKINKAFTYHEYTVKLGEVTINANTDYSLKNINSNGVSDFNKRSSSRENHWFLQENKAIYSSLSGGENLAR